jgi:hypothetical protein
MMMSGQLAPEASAVPEVAASGLHHARRENAMGDYDDYLVNDPIIGPLLQRLQAAEQRAAATEEQTRHNTAAMILKLKMEEAERLRQQHPTLDTDRLFQQAAEVGKRWAQWGSDLHDVHRLMTFDERVKQAGQDAFEKGREEGRRLGSSPQPAGPGLNPSGVIIPGAGGGSFEAAEEAAINDPQIRAIMLGQQEAL